MRPHKLFSVEPETPKSPVHRRLAALESEIRSLRPSRAPSEPPGPIPVDRTNRVLLCLAEMALHQIAIGELDAARRTIGDAVLVLDDAKDDAPVAHASVLLGEALLALDSPQHAKPRFVRALALCDRMLDKRWGLRARVGLGRTLVRLDDAVGCELLREAHGLCSDPALSAQIEAALREADKLFDTPRTVKTGYGRPVSVFPPARD